MKVKELKRLLNKVNDDLTVVILSPGFGGFTEVNVVCKDDIGGP